MSKAALSGIRVVDFSTTRAGIQASQLLADFGADVIFVEPRGGSPMRKEAAWPFWGRGKRSIELDLHNATDVATAQRLASGSDIVLETFRPGVAERLGIDYLLLSKDNPGLIYASITGFGRGNRYESLQGYDGIVQAMFGVNWLIEDMVDRPGPAFCTVTYPSFAATQLILHAILSALYERNGSGQGQRVETSLAHGLTTYDPYGWFSRVAAEAFGGGGVKQVPRIVDGVPSGGLSFRLLVALTKDGRWLQFSQSTNPLFKAMMQLFGLEWMFDDPKWRSLPDFETVEQRSDFWQILLDIVRTKTAAEWLVEFETHPNVWGEMFRRDSELLHHPQMLWNKMVSKVQDRDVGALRQPGPIVHLSGTPAEVDRPAPRLGEYDAAIVAETACPRMADADVPNPSAGKLPLDGVTIVELATFYAAPFGATLLCELGARVIKLEELDGEPHRNLLPFPEVGGIKGLLGKESVAVDLATPEGREVAHRIIAGADIVLQSFRGGVAERLGLDSATLRAINPDLIYHNAPGYGVDGPYARRPAFAPTIGSAAGIAWRNIGGSAQDGPDLASAAVRSNANHLSTAVMVGGNADGISAIVVGTAMLLGLVARQRGCGAQDLLTTMLSSTAHALSEVMVEYDGRPDVAVADAGLHGFNALYRLYDTAKEWIFLAAPNEAEWIRLKAAIPELAADSRFATAAERRENDAALAEALAAIFRTLPGQHWVDHLCAADVACVVAAAAPIEGNLMGSGSPGDEIGMSVPGFHPILGDIVRPAPLVSFSRSAARATDAGLVGQQTELVLREIGYSEQEIGALADKRVIALG